MLIAARNSFLMGGGSSTPTARDYVQDGLIAMWDGIENAGWGVHDASATTWADLVGRSATAPIPSGWSFSDKCLNVESSDSLTFPTQFYQTYTVEYLFQVVQYVNECLFESVAGNAGFRYKLTSGSGLQLYFNSGYLTVNTATYAETFLAPMSVSGSVVGQQTQGIVASYKNGSLVGSGTLEAPTATADTPSWSIGRRNTKYGCKQKCYAFRLYNRALTSDEIAANYAIDKARFNLP